MSRLYHLVAFVSECNKAAYITYGHEKTHFNGFFQGYKRHALQAQEKGLDLSPLNIFLLTSDDIEIRLLRENISYQDLSDFRHVYEQKIRNKGYEIISKQIPPPKGLTSPPVWNL